jgi:4-aminobutyrate aminotransferase-like enzyme
MQTVRKLNRRRFFADDECGNFFREFQTEHQTEAAHVFDDGRIIFREPAGTQVIRLLPPLNLKPEEAGEGISKIEEVIKSLA